MKIGELFVDLIIKSDQTPLKDFIKNLGELRMSSLLNTIGLGQMYEGIKKIMDIGDRTALAINNFSSTTGQSALEFQKWGKIAKQVGMDAQLVGSSVTHLVDSVMRLRLTGEGANAWNILGLDPRTAKDDFELLLKVAGKLDGLSVSEKRLKLGLLGLSPDLIPVLDYVLHNQAEVGKQLSNNADQLKKMAQWHQAINRLSDDWNTFLTHIASIFEPVLTGIVNLLDGAIKIADSLAHWIGPLMTILGIVIKIAAIFNPIAKGISVLGNSAILFGGALTAGDILGQSNPQPQPVSSRTNNNQITIHVQGANNPEETAQRTYKEFEKKMTGDAYYQSGRYNY